MPHCALARRQNNGGRAPFESIHAQLTNDFLVAFVACRNAGPAVCATEYWPCRTPYARARSVLPCDEGPFQVSHETLVHPAFQLLVFSASGRRQARAAAP